ncbi:MAG TPA: hypothetical protein VMW30_05845 [Candidatus Paceibacterota bacterium]|nr:hypothetical protein [Candidatus Paceibacterota bacterium]
MITIMSYRKLVTVLLTLLLSIPTTLASAAGSLGVNGILQIQTPFPLSVPATSDRIDISVSLPSSVTLGSNDVITWSASATMETVNGWATSFSSSGESTYTDGYFQITSLGRSATITFIPPTLSGDYAIHIQAAIGSHTYDVSGNIHVGSNIPPHYWLDSISGAKSTILNPSVGKDLQTTIGFIGSGVTDVTPVNWKGEPLKDGGYANDGQTVKFQVKYLDYLNQGFALKLHLWSCSTWIMECLNFYKTVPVTIDFPPPTQTVSASCEDVYKEKETFCHLSPDSMDPTGTKVQQGQNVKMTWSESVDGAITKSGTVDGLIGADTQVAIGPGTKPITFSARIVGQNVDVTTTAPSHAYSLLETVGVVWSISCQQSSGMAKCIAKPSVVPKTGFDMPATIPLQVVSNSSGIRKTLISVSVVPNGNYSFSVAVSTKIQSLNVRVSPSDSGASWKNPSFIMPLSNGDVSVTLSCPTYITSTFVCTVSPKSQVHSSQKITVLIQRRPGETGSWKLDQQVQLNLGQSKKVTLKGNGRALQVRASLKGFSGTSKIFSWADAQPKAKTGLFTVANTISALELSLGVKFEYGVAIPLWWNGVHLAEGYFTTDASNLFIMIYPSAGGLQGDDPRSLQVMQQMGNRNALVCNNMWIVYPPNIKQKISSAVNSVALANKVSCN